eukprot:gene13776-biopygen11096
MTVWTWSSTLERSDANRSKEALDHAQPAIITDRPAPAKPHSRGSRRLWCARRRRPGSTVPGARWRKRRRAGAF